MAGKPRILQELADQSRRKREAAFGPTKVTRDPTPEPESYSAPETVLPPEPEPEPIPRKPEPIEEPEFEEIPEVPRPLRLKDRPEPVVSAECYREIAGLGYHPQRLQLQARNGHRWSYPYAYLSLIDAPSPDLLVLHANCGAVEVVEIKGRGLMRSCHCLILNASAT